MSKLVWLLFLCAAASAQDSKRDCHPWPDVDPDVCSERGCLFDSNVEEGIPWCYYDDSVCPSLIPEASRVDCMPDEDTNFDACRQRGCSYCVTDSSDIPWCFVDNDVDQGGNFCPAGFPEEEKIDCHPEPDANAESCVARGCYWCESSTPGVPFCFMPKSRGYQMVGDPVPTPSGYQIQLSRLNYPSVIGAEFQNALVDVEFQTDERLRIRITDADNDRFKVPMEISGSNAPNPLYNVEFEPYPFAIKVIRRSNGAVIFDTSIGGLHLADQLLQFSTRLDSDNLYGFGEHEHHTLKLEMDWKVWPMWTRDHAVNTSINLYGQHPVYMNVEGSGDTHLVLIKNANAADVTLMPAPALAYRTIGGELDLYFFLGPSPAQAVGQYLSAVGNPVMVPYWSLGFQLCRWGYEDLDDMKDAVARMREYDIPHDVQYGDIDYMYERRDFTIDPEKWGDLPEYAEELLEEGTRFVIILDPAIYNQEPPGVYPAFDNGNALDVWVKDSQGLPIEGEVWPGPTYFPDYTNPNCEVWWTQECIDFKEKLNYAGLWIDMNEPANFVDGHADGCDNNKWNNPIFIPDLVDTLLTKTLCMDAQQTGGLFYNVHSLYGWSMAQQSLVAARAVENDVKRSVVFSRSTFPGAGKWGQHWLGDNWSDWSNLRWSIIGMLEFNWFGFPYNGVDICGFIGTPSEEMCMRWHQLGAFYPFSRNHNGEGNPHQDPGIWPEVARTTRETLLIRYTLLPFLYTLHHHAHIDGATVSRPLFFEFISDQEALSIHDQFLWGPSFLISPVLDQGVTSIEAYFPDTPWYSYYDGKLVSVRGEWTTLDAPIDFINLHVRGGYIIPIQQPARSTMFSRELPMGLIIALDDDGSAAGDIFWDDGEALDTQLSGSYFSAEFSVIDGELTNSITNNGYSGAESLEVDDIRIFGANPGISQITINGGPHSDWEQNLDTNEITISNAGVGLTDDMSVSWS